MWSVVILLHPYLVACSADFVLSCRTRTRMVGAVRRRCDKLSGDDHSRRLTVTGSLIMTTEVVSRFNQAVEGWGDIL